MLESVRYGSSVVMEGFVAGAVRVIAGKGKHVGALGLGFMRMSRGEGWRMEVRSGQILEQLTFHIWWCALCRYVHTKYPRVRNMIRPA